jgi:hypothetical protein
MRWKPRRERIKDGTIRTRSWFLLVPMALRYKGKEEWRWLEKASWTERYCHFQDRWFIQEWAD